MIRRLGFLVDIVICGRDSLRQNLLNVRPHLYIARLPSCKQTPCRAANSLRLIGSFRSGLRCGAMSAQRIRRTIRVSPDQPLMRRPGFCARQKAGQAVALTTRMAPRCVGGEHGNRNVPLSGVGGVHGQRRTVGAEQERLPGEKPSSKCETLNR